MRRLLDSIVATALVLGARSAAACSSCMTATDGTREAYYGTTLLLILVPLAAIGSIVWWLRRAARAQEASTLAARASSGAEHQA